MSIDIKTKLIKEISEILPIYKKHYDITTEILAIQNKYNTGDLKDFKFKVTNNIVDHEDKVKLKELLKVFYEFQPKYFSKALEIELLSLKNESDIENTEKAFLNDFDTISEKLFNGFKFSEIYKLFPSNPLLENYSNKTLFVNFNEKEPFGSKNITKLISSKINNHDKDETLQLIYNVENNKGKSSFVNLKIDFDKKSIEVIDLNKPNHSDVLKKFESNLGSSLATGSEELKSYNVKLTYDNYVIDNHKEFITDLLYYNVVKASWSLDGRKLLDESPYSFFNNPKFTIFDPFKDLKTKAYANMKTYEMLDEAKLKLESSTNEEILKDMKSHLAETIFDVSNETIEPANFDKYFEVPVEASSGWWFW
ncbi:MAG: hypothetical protein J0H68_02115 [Sphingobacteriia bacterium]|nr:hypothetical protein [Sphingobacteriia bacterium]